MANDLFGALGGSLGGLVKGLTSIMPQDDPAVKMVNAQTELAELKTKEEKLYAKIGRSAVEIYGLDSFAELADELRLVQSNMAAAQEKVDVLEREQKEAEEAAKAEEEARRAAMEPYICPNCGYENAEGMKFCNECGTKLGSQKTFCTSCGAELQTGARFCGECGQKMF